MLGLETLCQALGDLEGLDFGEDGGTGVARLFSRMPKLMETVELKWRLILLRLDLLQTENVRLYFIKEGLKVAFLVHGTNSIDVP